MIVVNAFAIPGAGHFSDNPVTPAWAELGQREKKSRISWYDQFGLATLTGLEDFSRQPLWADPLELDTTTRLASRFRQVLCLILVTWVTVLSTYGPRCYQQYVE